MKKKRPNRALPPVRSTKKAEKSVSQKIKKVTQGERVPRKTSLNENAY